MIINKSYNNVARIWATWTNNLGTAANPDTSAKIAIYPANSDTATVAQTDLTNFTTGVYYYTADVASWNCGQYMIRFTFVDGTVTQELTQNLDIVENISDLGSGSHPHSLHFENQNGVAKAGLQVWLTTDAAGAVLFTSKNNRTNSGGNITFNVALNTAYYVWTSESSTYAGSFTKTS